MQGNCHQVVDHGTASIRTLIEHRVSDTADLLDGGLPILTCPGDEPLSTLTRPASAFWAAMAVPGILTHMHTCSVQVCHVSVLVSPLGHRHYAHG